MDDSKFESEVVFDTPWFQVLTQRIEGSGEPYYTIAAPDFVVVVALTADKQLLMVRQFRPATNGYSLELPAGHVDAGESPEESVRKELREETGYEADTFELLAVLSPSTSRFRNRMWCFFAANARPAKGDPVEAGMKPVLYREPIRRLLEEKEFRSAGSCAALCVALMHGRIQV